MVLQLLQNLTGPKTLKTMMVASISPSSKKPDGSVSTYYENGTTFTKMPDGRTIVH